MTDAPIVYVPETAPPVVVEVPLTETEEAYFALVVDRFQVMLQQATQIKQEGLAILYRGKGIPAGSHVGTLPRTETEPAKLTYTAPYAVEAAAVPDDPEHPEYPTETGLMSTPPLSE